MASRLWTPGLLATVDEQAAIAQFLPPPQQTIPRREPVNNSTTTATPDWTGFSLNSYPIELSTYVSPFMVKRYQYRFPRSKKGRIRKKWAKDPRNWKTVEEDAIYRVFDSLYMHPKTFEKFKKAMTDRFEDKIAREVFAG